MGYINKITNKINGKCYIGQTIKHYETRFKQHQLNYTKPYFSQLLIYKAFNKYGIENFSFEPIEEVETKEELDEREKYWIKYYDSYYNGYNATLGGRATPLYEWNEEEVILKYHELKSARKVAQYYKCDHNVIDNILNRNKVKRYTIAEQNSKGILHLEKDEISLTFNTTKECGQWLISNHYTQSSNLTNVVHYLSECIRKKKKYCGFNIYYESKIQSAPLVTME